MSAAPKTDKLPPVSQEFMEIFSSHCGGCVRECRCGRTFFDSAGDWDWNDGELEDLQAKAKTDPEHYLETDYAITTYIINGLEFVEGCPCNGGAPYEQFLKQHGSRIAQYLTTWAKRLREQADSVDIKSEVVDTLKLDPPADVPMPPRKRGRVITL